MLSFQKQLHFTRRANGFWSSAAWVVFGPRSFLQRLIGLLPTTAWRHILVAKINCYLHFCALYLVVWAVSIPVHFLHGFWFKVRISWPLPYSRNCFTVLTTDALSISSDWLDWLSHDISHQLFPGIIVIQIIDGMRWLCWHFCSGKGPKLFILINDGCMLHT